MGGLAGVGRRQYLCCVGHCSAVNRWTLPECTISRQQSSLATLFDQSTLQVTTVTVGVACGVVLARVAIIVAVIDIGDGVIT